MNRRTLAARMTDERRAAASAARTERRRRQRARQTRVEREARLEDARRRSAAARAAESTQEHDERLAGDRRRRADEYARRDALLADDLRVRELVAAGVPTPIDDDARAAIAAEATTALWGDAMSEAVCAVCDELIVLAELHELELRDGEPLVDKMRTRLRAPAELRAVPALLAHYRVLVPGVTDFDDVLLSPRGVAR
jgi:hypothetical protein